MGLHSERLARDGLRRNAANAALRPLSAAEVARRAALDQRPVDWSWQAAAADPGCPACRELGRACVGHLGAWQDRQSAKLSDCDACGGRGRVIVEDDSGRFRFEACQACNAPRPYPGLRPGGLAKRALPELPRGLLSVPRERPGPEPVRGPAPAVVERMPGRRYGLEGVHCAHCGERGELPPGAFGLDAEGLRALDLCQVCGCEAVAVFPPEAGAIVAPSDRGSSFNRRYGDAVGRRVGR